MQIYEGFVHFKLAYCFSFWGLHPRPPPGLCPGPRWWTSVPQTPFAPPPTNSWRRHWSAVRPCTRCRLLSSLSSFHFQWRIFTYTSYHVLEALFATMRYINWHLHLHYAYVVLRWLGARHPSLSILHITHNKILQCFRWANCRQTMLSVYSQLAVVDFYRATRKQVRYMLRQLFCPSVRPSVRPLH